MEPVPRCGVPRSVEVTVPRNTYRLYFSRDDNPGLSGYYFRGKNSQGKGREFKNKVNLVSVVLMLCPADFKKERVLAFQMVDRKQRLQGRPTCRLGPPPKGSGKNVTEARQQDSAADPGSTEGDGDQASGADGDDEGVDEGEEQEPPSTLNEAVAPKGSRGVASWKKIDRFARALGMVAVALCLICIAGVAFFARHFKKKLDRIEKTSSEGS
jgi:hypothetical protein